MSDDLDRAREALKYCSSYTRLPTLLALWAGLAVEYRDWLVLLGEEWPSCDNIGQHLDDLWETPFADVLDRPSELRHLLMDKAERAAFNALPDHFEVWRGCYSANKWGVSWSLDRAAAQRFPMLHRYRQAGQPILVRARANKSDAAFLKLDRGESEIVIHRPRHISTSHARPDRQV